MNKCWVVLDYSDLHRSIEGVVPVLFISGFYSQRHFSLDTMTLWYSYLFQMVTFLPRGQWEALET